MILIYGPIFLHMGSNRHPMKPEKKRKPFIPSSRGGILH